MTKIMSSIHKMSLVFQDPCHGYSLYYITIVILELRLLFSPSINKRDEEER